MVVLEFIFPRMVVLWEIGNLGSDESIEEYLMEEWIYCKYPPVCGPTSFPLSPPSFPLYLPPTSSPFRVRTRQNLFHDFQNQQHEDVVDLPVVRLTLVVDYLIEERGGELNVINGLEGGALNVSNRLEGSALKDFFFVLSWVEINELEHQHEDIIDQLAIDYAGVDHDVIGYGGGKWQHISGGGEFTMNGVEYRRGQAWSTTPEPSVVFETKLSVRVWLGHRGQWVVDIRYGWNWLNLGTFRTAEGAPLAAESVARLRGGKDLFDRPFLIEYRSEPLQLPPTTQEENQDDGIGSEGTGDCAMADQAQFNFGCLEKGKTREKNPSGERRNKKANGVKITIPLDDILRFKEMRLNDAANRLKVGRSTLKRICRGYGINRWPPRKELISQSRPNESPMVVDQEQIPQLNPDTLLPSNQVPANSDKYSVKVKCEDGTIIKFRLSSPLGKVELEQEVKKRLSFEAGTYDIKYKDEDDDLILISCDEDLAECISSSSAVGSRSIELFLKLK